MSYYDSYRLTILVPNHINGLSSVPLCLVSMFLYILCFFIAWLWKALIFFTEYYWWYDLFLLELTILACKNCLEVGLILRSIKSKHIWQYFLNPEMDIPVTQEIPLFRIVIYAFFFGTMYVIELFIDSLFCVSKICRDSLRNLSAWNGKIVFLGGFRAGCHFICNGIHHSYCFIPCLLLILLSWSTIICCKVHDCWECVEEERCFASIVLSKLFFSNP